MQEQENVERQTRTLRLPGEVTIELLLDGDNFKGFGVITVQGVPLRAATVPLRAAIQTPEGVNYRSFRLEQVVEKEDEARLVTTAIGVPEVFGEYRDEYDLQMARPRVQPESYEDRVEWLFRPESLTLDGVHYRGFSYAVRFASDSRSIHQITVQATWELGGMATGNTLLYQGQVNPPVHRCARESRFTTACLRQLSLIDSPMGYSFQFTSRYSPNQCCDFQHGPAGCLLGFWPEFLDVHSLVQKNPDEEVVWVLDKYLFPLSSEVALPRKCILFSPAPAEGLPDHVARNQWQRALEHAQDVVRSAYGIPRTRTLPEGGGSYGCKLDKAGKLLMRIGGEDVPPEKALYAWADQLPAMAECGIKRAAPEVIAETDVSEAGYRYKLQTGLHGDLMVSSVCQVWRYRPARFWGGWEAWRHYYNKAKESGLEVGHWIGMHLSPNAPVLKEHPEYLCRHVNTRPHSGGYAINISCGLNWNNAWPWMLEQFREWKEEGGLDYVFFDSIGNLGFLGVDYAARMQPNGEGIARFIQGLARLGIRAYSVEGISPMGIGRFGLSDNMSESMPASQGVAGQNDWSWYVGNEDMLIDTIPGIHLHPDRSEQEVRLQVFRCIANRCVPSLAATDSPEFLTEHKWYVPDWLREYYWTFNQLCDLMVRRELLSGFKGVRWTGGDGEVLFAFETFNHPLAPGAKVERVCGRTVEAVRAEEVLMTSPLTAYRIW